ncbi:MAG: hypothetical protein A2942_04000 [Candidatus Lloydbacteria bacterium RIFCSPLOWO2_01_FULL_50_20]|uniref:Uncharacterized protein n=1 Tax=Candidatus Lloydbacteria bacterium RIFCSPLOWO2_01_FULL_50_20 TaxID=1798665 RepID=A0A1G2DJW7_9BACT|nr:MAG: hypothetical protein A3C13_03180 [Candidatus Lloydbacteria bacterium RIFCSPHIGHO2_02_FULL_50_11]OGZ13702.1 MAG: hypothetical protein A2942_04000 [Candidatus Lloydbacteria bacterium RIFCSPLOWO2_01_FULL_50_20]
MFAQFEEYDRKIFWTLVAIGAGALLLYVYFLSMSVVSVVARKDAEREVGRMTARVATLESQYALLDRDIDLTLAHARGFVDVAVPKYISNTVEETVLTLREEVSEN